MEWSHALSLEDKRMEADNLNQLQYMKDLFENHLPIGDNKSHISEYFSRLEELISTKENIAPEQFENDDPTKDYKYFSAALLRELASRPVIQPDGEVVGDPSNRIELGNQVQDSDQVLSDIQCIPECPTDPFSDDSDSDGNEENDRYLSGELERV